MGTVQLSHQPKECCKTGTTEMDSSKLVEDDILSMLSAIEELADKLDTEAPFSKKNKTDLKGKVKLMVSGIRENRNLRREFMERPKVQRTYASAAAGRVIAPLSPPTESTVVIYPTSSLNNSQTRSLVKTKVDFRQLQVGVTRVKNLRNGGLMLSTSSKVDAEVIEKQLAREEGMFDARKLKKRDPYLIVYGIEKDVEQATLYDTICVQNNISARDSSIGTSQDDIEGSLDLFKVMKTLKANNDYTYHAVIRVSPNTYKVMMERRKLFIGMTCCSVKKFSWTMKCYKCQAFGHTQKNCISNEEICGKCSAVHPTRDCSSGKEQCINCIRPNKRIQINRLDLQIIRLFKGLVRAISTLLGLLIKGLIMADTRSNSIKVHSNRNKFIKCIQLNAVKDMDTLGQLMLEECVDIAFIQEPYTRDNKVSGIPSHFNIFQKSSPNQRIKSAIAINTSKLHTTLDAKLTDHNTFYALVYPWPYPWWSFTP